MAPRRSRVMRTVLHQSTTSVLLGIVACAAGPVFGQTSGTKARQRSANPPELKRLESKAEEIRESFLRDTNQLIKQFEDVGQYERARVLVDALAKLDPQNEPVKTKLGELSTKILDAGEFEVGLNLGKSWQPVGTVERGRTVRIRVSGDYRIVANIEAGPDGAPGDNPAEDLIPHVPFGAVMAVIADADASKRSGEKQPRPFTVGGSYEKPAERDGILFLKVNVPPGAKCTGKLTALVSGAAKP